MQGSRMNVGAVLLDLHPYAMFLAPHVNVNPRRLYSVLRESLANRRDTVHRHVAPLAVPLAQAAATVFRKIP